MKAIIIFLLFAFSSVAFSKDVHIFKISEDCLDDVKISQSRETLKWRVDLHLNYANGGRAMTKLSTRIIGQKLAIANGSGDLIDHPPARVLTILGSALRLEFPSKKKALAALNSLSSSKGQCAEYSNT